jgi:hypothetical protein
MVQTILAKYIKFYEFEEQFNLQPIESSIHPYARAKLVRCPASTQTHR